MSGTDPSHWIKLLHAKQHIKELKEEIAGYVGGDPYHVVHEVKTNAKKQRVVFRLYMEPPDQWLAATLGDVVHDLRSALDHLAVSFAPNRRKHKASFPILTDDIWAVDADGHLLAKHEGRRKHFNVEVMDMPAHVVAHIQSLQPYLDGERAELNLLAILSSLENADKHRWLVATAVGIGQRYTTTATGIAEDGTELWSLPFHGARPTENEMDVQLRGEAEVAFKMGKAQGMLEFAEIERMSDFVAHSVLSPLSPWTPAEGE